MHFYANKIAEGKYGSADDHNHNLSYKHNVYHRKLKPLSYYFLTDFTFFSSLFSLDRLLRYNNNYVETKKKRDVINLVIVFITTYKSKLTRA